MTRGNIKKSSVALSVLNVVFGEKKQIATALCGRPALGAAKVGKRTVRPRRRLRGVSRAAPLGVGVHVGDYQQVFIIGASLAGVLASRKPFEAVLALQPKSGWVSKNFSNRRAGPSQNPKLGQKASAIFVKTFRSVFWRCSAT